MKTCHLCKEQKDLSNFNKNNGRKDGYASTCRLCMKTYRKTYYEANKTEVIKKNTSRNKATKAKFMEYKSTLSCEECGFSHPAALDFHHREGVEKIDHVGRMVGSTRSKTVIETEINKCIILCANCHRIHHFNERQDK
jgi:hypothetical protein